MTQTKTGTIELPTVTAVALWQAEITGQLSDGAWENAAPLDHWKFWCRLEAKHTPGVAKVTTTEPWQCKKTGYNLATLYQYVGDRMLAYGRMARAFEASGIADPSREQIDAGEYLESLGSLDNLKKALEPGSGIDEWKFRSLKTVPHDVAAAFYQVSYTMKDMKKDIVAIKAAMKTARQQ